MSDTRPDGAGGGESAARGEQSVPAASPGAAVPRAIAAACVILLLEALALTGVAAFLLFDTAVGSPHSVAGALLGAALALAGAGVLVLCARGLNRLRPAARTPVVVLQLLALPVSYSLGFQAGFVAVGGPMLAAALAVIYLLFTPPARAALDRDIGR